MALDPSYDSKTLDELQDEFVLLGNQLSQVDTKRKDILALMDRKKAALLAGLRADNLSPVEKEAFRQVLFSRGIVL